MVSTDFQTRLREHEDIRERDCSDGIKSYNFTRKAFYKGKWDKTSVEARGLFMKDGEIVGRGYNKFFNMNEPNGFSRDEILDTFEYPVVVSDKINGYLAVAFAFEGDLKVFSKSGDGTDYSEEADRIVRDTLGEEIHAFVSKLQGENGESFSATFEIISSSDVHIVDEHEERAVLLDIIVNSEVFTPLSKKTSEWLARQFGFDFSNYRIIENREDLERELNEAKNSRSEGIVLRDVAGRMSKIKSDYYVKLKRLRYDLDRLARGESAKRFKKLNEFDFAKNMENYSVQSFQSVKADIPKIANEFDILSVLDDA